jgi:hypothetical protein
VTLSNSIVTFRFKWGDHSICLLVDLDKKTTFTQEFSSVWNKEFGVLNHDMAGERSGVFSSLLIEDITALEGKTKFFYFEIPNLGKQRHAEIENELMDTIAKLTTSDRPIDVTVSVESRAAMAPAVDKDRLQQFAASMKW